MHTKRTRADHKGFTLCAVLLLAPSPAWAPAGLRQHSAHAAEKKARGDDLQSLTPSPPTLSPDDAAAARWARNPLDAPEPPSAAAIGASRPARATPLGVVPASPLVDTTLATLAWVHDGTVLALGEHTPSQDRFALLVADRITREHHAMDVRLLELLRRVAGLYPGARFELVSGYRSWKFNEMLRKKGHKVASESQHSHGHAVDFRVLPADDPSQAVDPFVLERQLRDDLGWVGGIGAYPSRSDRFVHADVGRQRRWTGR